MLHRVKPPEYAPLLMQVVEFEKKLLRWICTSPVTFTVEGAQAAFGNDDQAKWLWERIERGSKKNSFGEAVQNAIQYVQQHPTVGQWLLQCVENDLDFHQHFTDIQFSFVEWRLPAGGITAKDLSVFINPMLVNLYETIFGGTGFPAIIHQGSAVDKLTRTCWNENFWTTNTSLGVCPVCDGKKPDLVRKSRASDLDHFFPKERYPLLSVHPYNLIPTCSTCNSRAKGTRDPLNDHAAETLLDTFYPYYCPAIEHIELQISKPSIGIKITIREQDGSSSKRIDNFVRVFDLETRWADWYKNYIDNRIEVIRWRSFTTQDQVRDYLQNDLTDNSILQAKQENCFVYANFLQYLLNDPQEFEDLCVSMGIQ